MKPVAVLCLLLMAILRPADAGEIAVADAAGLSRAVAAAAAGDIIVLAPGQYRMGRTATRAAGTAEQPIVVRAAALGDARITVASVVGFAIEHAHWRFENLDFLGSPRTEHAFQVVGRGHHFVIRGNRIVDFAAGIKVNGIPVGDGRIYPNDGLIENNLFYNRTVLDTDGWITPVDIVGGQRWTVRGNFIADFAKAKQDHIFDGAFLKGNSRDGVIERNLVICAWRLPGGNRRGISLGATGTGPTMCDGGGCSAEHVGGIVRNNVVMNCAGQPGIHLYRAPGSRVASNSIFGADGILAQAVETTGDVQNNLVAGGLRTEQGATLRTGRNVILPSSAAVSADREAVRGEPLADVGDDFCGQPRPPAPALGAAEPGCSIPARLKAIEDLVARLP